MKYKVTYENDVTITYEAIVEAESEEEAMDKVGEGDIISEEEIDYQGNEIRPMETEQMEENKC